MKQSLKRRGYSLVELLMSIGVLVIAMDISASLFRSVLKVGATNQLDANQSARVETALAKMRVDVWGASSMQAVDSQTLKLSRSDGSSVTWTIGPDHSLQRTDAPGHAEQWPDIAKAWTFSVEGAAITISDDKSKDQTAVRMVSQILLAGRMP